MVFSKSFCLFFLARIRRPCELQKVKNLIPGFSPKGRHVNRVGFDAPLPPPVAFVELDYFLLDLADVPDSLLLSDESIGIFVKTDTISTTWFGKSEDLVLLLFQANTRPRCNTANTVPVPNWPLGLGRWPWPRSPCPTDDVERRR